MSTANARRGRTVRAADLFCGAGGTSSGLADACADLGLGLSLLAINHWQIAIDTHSSNHIYAQHRCESLDSVDPRKAVPGGHLHILCASPECTHHSIARGGKPMSDQSRASAWHVLRWAEALRVDNILIENVREFRDWGPLGVNGRPLKRRKGETYQAFLVALRSLGYVAEERILRAADFGDPTTRERLFILAKRGNRRISWPEPSHSPTGAVTLFGELPKWRAAREIIDWSIPGESIFNRKRPLSPNTLKRIAAGLRKFSGLPFVLSVRGGKDGYVRASDIEAPMPTVTTVSPLAVVEPFLVMLNGTRGKQLECSSRSIHAPVPTITGAPHLYLCEPFVVPTNHGTGDLRTYSLDRPMPAITSFDAWGLIEPFLVEYHGSSYEGGERVRSVERPMPAVATSNQFGLVQPFLVKYNGTGGAHSVERPFDTVTTKERFGLVLPHLDGAVLDIRYRMIQPHELARAQGFPETYRFAGNREERVRQIGNAVPVNLAKALCKAMLT